MFSHLRDIKFKLFVCRHPTKSSHSRLSDLVASLQTYQIMNALLMTYNGKPVVETEIKCMLKFPVKYKMVSELIYAELSWCVTVPSH